MYICKSSTPSAVSVCISVRVCAYAVRVLGHACGQHGQLAFYVKLTPPPHRLLSSLFVLTVTWATVQRLLLPNQ